MPRFLAKIPKISIFEMLIYFSAIFYLTVFPSHVVSNSHDSGSQAAFEYWLVNGYQWGNDIFQNVGPLGFLMFPGIYTEHINAYLKAAINIFLYVYCFYIIFYREYKSIFIKYFLLLVILFFGKQWSLLNLSIIIISLEIFRYSTYKNIFAVIPFLCIITLTKGTYLIASILIIFEYLIISIFMNKGKKEVILVALIYVAGLVCLWVSLGQKPSYILNYLIGMLDFSASYGTTMMIDGSPLWLAISVCILFCFAVDLAVINSQISREALKSNILANISKRATIFFIPMLIIFSIWKHGFVREDGHQLIFFQSALLIMLVIFDMAFFRSISRLYIKIIFIFFNFAFFLLIFTSNLAFERVYNFSQLMNLMISSSHNLENTKKFIFDDNLTVLKSQIEEEKKKFSPKDLISYINGGLVSFFGTRPAPFLYGVNYIPMPSTISFASWSRWIQAKDSDFLRTLPEYVVWQVETIDGRFYPSDGALSQIEMLANYRGVYRYDDMLLMKRVSNTNPSFNTILINESNKIGDKVDLPLSKGNLYLRVNPKESLFIKIKNIIYKPNIYFIEYTLSDGSLHRERINISQARIGFLIEPLIKSADNLHAALDKNMHINQVAPINHMISFRIVCETSKFCAKTFGLELLQVQGLNLGSSSIDSSNQYGIDYRSLKSEVSVKAFVPLEGVRQGAHVRYLYHAPAEIVLRPHVPAHELEISYGMFASAWAQGSASDGIRMRIVGTINKKDFVLFEGYVDPLRKMEDRETLSTVITFDKNYETISIKIDPMVNNYSDHFFIENIYIR